MKNKSIVSLLILLMGLSFTTSSCSDMLTPDLDRFSGNKQNTDTLYRYWGIMKSMQNIAERYVVLGESRGDLVSSTVYTSDSIHGIMNFENPADGSNGLLRAADYYYVINQCNSYLEATDSSTIKDGVYYMRRESAEVHAIRAWVYLQLVQNYGSVPFVSKFVEDANESIKLMETAPKANKDNLLSLLVKEGLARAGQWQDVYGYIDYGAYNTGSGTKIASTVCVFPIDVIMGELYMLKGEYESAAKTYYKFLYERIPLFDPYSYSVGLYNSFNGSNYTYSFNPKSYNSGIFNTYSDGKAFGGRVSPEPLTMIPSAANKTFGTVLTSIQNVYGYAAESRQYTSEFTDEEGKVTAVTSGVVTLTADETYRQIVPSSNYQTLSDEQIPFAYDGSGNGVNIPIRDLGDGRISAAAPKVSIDGETYRFIAKFNPTNVSYTFSNNRPYDFNMHYSIPIYRKSLIYLRYAEALNRAGFPQHAFAIIRDGLSNSTLPFYSEKIVDPNVYEINPSDPTDTISVNGEPYVPGMELLPNRIDTVRTLNVYTGGDGIIVSGETTYAYYVDKIEGMKAQNTDYVKYHGIDRFNTNKTGTRSHGCLNIAGYTDTIYTYSKMVASKIAENWARTNNKNEIDQKNYANSLLMYTKEYITSGSYELKEEVKRNMKAEIQNAVEDLLVDELALETCFEGNRYYDLMRIANNKTRAGLDGNVWFAWKIARRNSKVTDGLNYIADPALYGKLQNTGNWFLPFPKR